MKRENYLKWSLLLLLFFISIFASTWIRTQCTNMHFLISRIQIKKEETITIKRNFEIEHARLKSPEYIRRLGESRFDLSMPKTENIFRLNGKKDEE